MACSADGTAMASAASSITQVHLILNLCLQHKCRFPCLHVCRWSSPESVGIQSFTATAGASASAQLIHFECLTRMTSVTLKSSEPDSASGCRRASAAAPRFACGQPPAALELPHCAGTPVLSTISPSPLTAAGWRPPAAVTATARLCCGRSQPGRQPRQAPWIRRPLTSPGCRGPGCRSCYPQVRYIGSKILLIHGDVMPSKSQAASISSTHINTSSLAKQCCIEFHSYRSISRSSASSRKSNEVPQHSCIASAGRRCAVDAGADAPGDAATGAFPCGRKPRADSADSEQPRQRWGY